MKNLTWSGVLVFAAVVIVGKYIVLTTLPPYRLVQPDGREAQRGRAAPRLDANECIRSAVQLLQKLTPITSGKAGGFDITMEFGKLEGTVSRHGAFRRLAGGAQRAPLPPPRRQGRAVRRRFGRIVQCRHRRHTTFGLGGSQRMFITTHTGRGGQFPDEVAESVCVNVR